LSSGSTVARIQIPSIGLSEMVLEGTSEWILQRGAGHIAGTDYPGGEGNIGIAGHRDRSFRKLKNISKHDKIVLQTLHGTYIYRVSGISIVDPTDVKVLSRTPQPTLTLVTCYPFYFIGNAPKRYIVRAGLVSPRLGYRAHGREMAANGRRDIGTDP
jgi:sortase A